MSVEVSLEVRRSYRVRESNSSWKYKEPEEWGEWSDWAPFKPVSAGGNPHRVYTKKGLKSAINYLNKDRYPGAIRTEYRVVARVVMPWVEIHENEINELMKEA